MRIEFSDGARALAAIKTVLSHASKDATRPHLYGVHFRCNDTTVDIVATDGHRLALYRVPASEVSMTASGDVDRCTVPSDVLAPFVKAKAGTQVPVILDADAGEIAFGSTVARFAAKDAQEIVFPPYDQVFPQTLSSDGIPCIAPYYLADACDAFTALLKQRRSSTAGLCVVSSGPEGPMVLRDMAVPEFVVIVMPIRGRVNRTSPALMFADTSRLPGDDSEPDVTRTVDAAAE